MATVANRITLQVMGMDCAGCARSIESAVQQLEGVDRCELNFTTEKLHVTGGINRLAVIARVKEAGFEAFDPQIEMIEADSASVPQNFWHYLWQRKETRLALVGALFILPGLLFEELFGYAHPLIDIASILAMLLAGLPIAQSAWRSIAVSREININVLMTLAAIGAIVIGAYTEAGMVMVLFALGESLEGYTASRARNAIRSLMQVAPQMALRLGEGMDREGMDSKGVDSALVHIRELAVGDRLLVKPGERIPMDGRVCAGVSSVNQAAITGESRLVEKGANAEMDSRLYAGSMNGEGALEMVVTHLAEDNTISRLIAMVEDAQEKKAPAQRFVDRLAKIYTPIVVLLAALVAIIPPLFFNQPFFNPEPTTFGWLYRGLTLLVVACPCALVISTPVTIISAISNAARNGVLIKGGAYLERLNQVRVVALDKTGTLTEGRPTVLNIRSADCMNEHHMDAHHMDAQHMDTHCMDGQMAEVCPACLDLLALASAVEQQSEHPLATAIVNESDRLGLNRRYAGAASVRALTGRGVIGQVDGRQITIGSHRHFDQSIAHTAAQCESAKRDAALGYTPMMIGVADRYLGTITVADQVRPSSQKTVAALRRAGLEKVVMLTGDNRATAQVVGTQVGITDGVDIAAELLPGDKLAMIERLQQQSGPVAMVGDGINDAPALATADVGIAIGGASGTTQAMETADITLMGDDLRQLPFAFRLSRAAMRTISANVVLSIGIKFIFLILVLLGWGTMWMAVVADVGASLLVTLNGMRLMRFEARSQLL